MTRYYLHPTSTQHEGATWRTGALLLALGAFRPRAMHYHRNQPRTYSFALNGRTTVETLQAALDANLGGYYWQVRNLAEDRAHDSAPPCARAMGCLCALHARSPKSRKACDAREVRG